MVVSLSSCYQHYYCVIQQLSYTAECRFEIMLCLCRKYILAVIRETKKKHPAKTNKKKEHKQVITNIRNVTRQEWRKRKK